MACDYRTEVLEQFVVPKPTPTDIVVKKLIWPDIPERESLLDYHPKTGAGYSITTEIVGSGASSYLRIVPQVDASGAAWSPEQQELLKQLKYIPMPEEPMEGRKPVLQMMRSGHGNLRLGNTHWYLVYSRIEKTQLHGKLLNDVTLIWEFVDPERPTEYLKPIASCWKW